jgi:hypothetical protein
LRVFQQSYAPPGGFRLALDLRLSCARIRASLESSLDDKNEYSLMID